MQTELGRLQITIKIGNLQTNRSPMFRIQSSRFVSTTKAVVRLWDTNFELLKTIKKGDSAIINLGYANLSKHAWEFEVESIHEIRRNTLDIKLVQNDVRLKRTIIKKNWENEAPAPIVRNIIEQTGFQAGDIEEIPVIFPKFIAGSKSAWDTVKFLERSLRLSHQTTVSQMALWMDDSGKLNWNGKFEKSDPVRVFSVGSGLVKHNVNSRVSGIEKGENADIPLNSLETFLSPELKHSSAIRVTDKRRGVDGEFPVIDVEHRFENNSAATFINYLPDSSYVE